MISRVICGAVVVVSVMVILTGCGRQVAPGPLEDPDLLATSPNRETLPVPRPWVASAFDATGGMGTWLKCRQLKLSTVVTAYQQDGSVYLTEHDFRVYPWSDAIQVSACEPQADLACQIVGGQYSPLQADLSQAVSPLSESYREYAEAVLQITTAPVRMLDRSVALTRRPLSVQIAGQWYHPLEAKYRAKEIVSRAQGRDETVVVEPYWTRGIYFQSQDKFLVDMIWLANSAGQKFLIVRGYDYAKSAGVLIPTKIEVFQSDPDVNFGPRLALLDLKQ